MHFTFTKADAALAARGVFHRRGARAADLTNAQIPPAHCNGRLARGPSRRLLQCGLYGRRGSPSSRRHGTRLEAIQQRITQLSGPGHPGATQLAKIVDALDPVAACESVLAVKVARL